MAFDPEKEKKLLAVLVTALVLLIAYRVATSDKPKMAQLMYPPGSVAVSPIRGGASSAAGAGPLAVFIERRNEKFPGVVRNIFMMEDFAPKPKPKPVIQQPVGPPPPPPVPEKTPEEIAKERARVDLGKFRFLGYLAEKDSSLFLSKDGELYIVKKGDRILNSYIVKETGNDYVVLLDAATNVDARVDLSGSDPDQAPKSPR